MYKGWLCLPAKHDASPIIQWYVTFSGWDLLLCEVEMLLDQIPQGSGRSQSQSHKVTGVRSENENCQVWKWKLSGLKVKVVKVLKWKLSGLKVKVVRILKWKLSSLKGKAIGIWKWHMSVYESKSCQHRKVKVVKNYMKYISGIHIGPTIQQFQFLYMMKSHIQMHESWEDARSFKSV